jgi:tetratricopeptide (TPR) repeat protein
LKRLGEAIGTYRNALPASADREAVNAKIALAESQRHTFLDACETKTGDAALHACEAAWLPGAPDEVTVFKRRGMLLQADNKPSPALDAYMAAARLDPGDHSVALAIVSLSDSTGREDALTLAARGHALMALGRPTEALDPLRQALRLAPDLVEAKAELRLATLSPRAGRAERPAADVNGGPAGDKTAAPPAIIAAANAGAAGNAGAAAPRRYSNDAPATRTN